MSEILTADERQQSKQAVLGKIPASCPYRVFPLDHVETHVGSGGRPVQQALGARPDADLVPFPQQEDAGHVRGHWTARPVPRPPARRLPRHHQLPTALLGTVDIPGAVGRFDDC